MLALALKKSLRNKSQGLAIVLCSFISAAVVFFCSFSHLTLQEHWIVAAKEHMGTRHATAFNWNQNAIDFLSQQQSVKSIEDYTFVNMSGLYDFQNSNVLELENMVIGSKTYNQSELVEGVLPTESNVNCVVEQWLSEKFGIRIGDFITFEYTLPGPAGLVIESHLKVVGVLETNINNQRANSQIVYVSTTGIEFWSWDMRRTTYVEFENVESAPQALQDVESQLAEREMLSNPAFLNNYFTYSSSSKAEATRLFFVVLAILSVLTFFSTFASFNNLLKKQRLVFKQTRDLGGTKGQVMSLNLTVVAIWSLVGSVAALFVTILGCLIWAISIGNVFRVSWSLALLTVAFNCAFSMLPCFLGVNKMYKELKVQKKNEKKLVKVKKEQSHAQTICRIHFKQAVKGLRQNKFFAISMVVLAVTSATSLSLLSGLSFEENINAQYYANYVMRSLSSTKYANADYMSEQVVQDITEIEGVSGTTLVYGSNLAIMDKEVLDDPKKEENFSDYVNGFAVAIAPEDKYIEATLQYLVKGNPTMEQLKSGKYVLVRQYGSHGIKVGDTILLQNMLAVNASFPTANMSKDLVFTEVTVGGIVSMFATDDNLISKMDMMVTQNLFMQLEPNPRIFSMGVFGNGIEESLEKFVAQHSEIELVSLEDIVFWINDKAGFVERLLVSFCVALITISLFSTINLVVSKIQSTKKDRFLLYCQGATVLQRSGVYLVAIFLPLMLTLLFVFPLTYLLAPELTTFINLTRVVPMFFDRRFVLLGCGVVMVVLIASIVIVSAFEIASRHTSQKHFESARID